MNVKREKTYKERNLIGKLETYTTMDICLHLVTKQALWKWGHFERARHTFKMLPVFWFLVYFVKRFRYFNALNIGSVGLRAAKLLSIKLWEWFKPSRSRTRTDLFKCCQGQMADFFLRRPTFKASNFAALLSTDLIFTALKDQNLF